MSVDEASRTEKEVDSEIPKQLYKYRDLSQPKWLQRVFTHREVYFSAPSSFNDPHDCRVQERFDGSQEAWGKYFRRLLANREPGLSRTEKRLKAKKMAAQVKSKEARKKILQSVQDDLDGTGMYCLSRRPDSNLMWSYYAGGHTGICLRFNHVEDLFLGVRVRCAQDVEYADAHPEVNHLTSSDWERAKAALLTKSVEWAHEEEWRYIDQGGMPGPRTFRPGGLNGVILGCKITPEDREIVMQWIDESEEEPELFQVELEDFTFRLKIVPVG